MEGDRVRLQQRGPRNISTHALHMEGDPERTGWSCPANKDFYPRPRVEGDIRSCHCTTIDAISTHALA